MHQAELRAPRQVAAARGPLLLVLLLGAAAAGVGAAAPPFEDTMAQRMLACTGCHGRDGRATPDGYYPRIAGKPPAYLFRQLQAFRDGRRRYEPMARLLAPLNDAYLREIASYFATLDLPYAAPVEVAAGDGQRARQLLYEGDATRGLPACAACHGTALTGVWPDVPGLLGLSADYLNAQLGAWRIDVRHAAAPDCMADVARKLNPGDVALLSRWLAAQPLPQPPRAVTSLKATPPLDCGSMPPR